MKFQFMASYLCWDEEDMFYHLCTSLEETAGQDLWDINSRATTADIVHLLQTRFGTQSTPLHLQGGLLSHSAKAK